MSITERSTPLWCSWCGEDEADGNHGQCPTTRIETRRAVLGATLTELATAPSPPPLDLLHRAGRQTAIYRGEFTGPDGLLPDWAGDSPEYKHAIQGLYIETGIPADSKSNLQSNLRYHTGNALRDVAPVEELVALGLDPDGPRARARRRLR